MEVPKDPVKFQLNDVDIDEDGILEDGDLTDMSRLNTGKPNSGISRYKDDRSPSDGHKVNVLNPYVEGLASFR